MTVGFIGAGNMATAIIKGIIENGFCKASDIFINEKSEDKVKHLIDTYKVNSLLSKDELVSTCDIVLLAVKPNQFEDIINEISIKEINDHVFVSIAAGLTISNIEKMFNREIKLVRCMPNTPAFVGEGMTGICGNNNISEKELDIVLNLFKTIGKAHIVNENQMDAVVAVSGSSPAYVYMMIEAMADAAVSEGLERSKAYEFAAQAVLGSAKMVLDSNIHPGELKDKVCSPGGTTIEAVKVLEEKGFRSSIIDAMKACANKSRDLKKQ